MIQHESDQLRYHWTPRPEAAALVHRLVEQFLADNLWSAQFARRLAQETGTRLFDWIDSRNYHVKYEVFVRPKDGGGEPRSVDPREIFPRSLRHLLLQSYIVGNVWLHECEA